MSTIAFFFVLKCVHVYILCCARPFHTRDCFYRAFRQLFDLIPFAKMIKGPIQTLFTRVCAVTQNVCYITSKSLNLLDALNVWARLEKFIHRKRSDVKDSAANRRPRKTLSSAQKFETSISLKNTSFVFWVFFNVMSPNSIRNENTKKMKKKKSQKQKRVIFFPSMSLFIHWTVLLTQHEVIQFVFSHTNKDHNFFCTTKWYHLLKSEKNIFNFKEDRMEL